MRVIWPPRSGSFAAYLRPGGLAVIIDGQKASTSAEFLNGFVADNNPMGHDGTFLDERTAGLLADAGFEVIEDRMHDLPWMFADGR